MELENRLGPHPRRRRHHLFHRMELENRLGPMRAAGAIISSTEMMIYELMRSSSSTAFKELLPHLKG
jgi:hypothetical protein